MRSCVSKIGMRLQNTFLVNLGRENEDNAGFFRRLLMDQLRETVTGIEKLPGGANSEVFRILTDRNNEFIAKKYHRRKGDARDRLSTEFFGLSFLWEKGIRNIPEPILACKESCIALYKFIKGTKIRPGEIVLNDVDEAADFAERLHALVDSKGADTQPIASEACFSVQAYINCVDGRVDNLKKAIKKDPISDLLRVYLEDDFMPFFDAAKKEAKRRAERLSIDIDENLHKNEQTLSVSDFGFHNVIKSDNGHLFFLDFEYYGWDDPAKMIADFYLQPAVPVPLNYRARFFEKVRKNYREDTKLEKRLSIIYPILGLKWCLITLNVFFCINNGESDKTICLKHLAKALSKLQEIKHEMDLKVFPISLS